MALPRPELANQKAHNERLLERMKKKTKTNKQQQKKKKNRGKKSRLHERLVKMKKAAKAILFMNEELANATCQLMIMEYESDDEHQIRLSAWILLAFYKIKIFCCPACSFVSLISPQQDGLQIH